MHPKGYLHRLVFIAALIAPAVVGCNCGSDKKGGGITLADGAVAGDGGWTIGNDGGIVYARDGGVVITPGDGGTPWVCKVVVCSGRVTACGDCADNDGDGKVDQNDPECLGPCDNYEGEELLAGVGGEGGEQCKADCYFDFGNGAGNDTCKWHRSCDPLTPKEQCVYDERKLGGKDCPDQQTDLCDSYCGPLTPNGCDCFGCCAFPELANAGPNGGQGYVYIGSESGCTFDTVTQQENCQACTPAASCLNTCERCEICLGKPEIPADCFGTPDAGVPDSGTPDAGPPGERCPTGVTACGLPGDPECAENEFCITGCCIRAPE